MGRFFLRIKDLEQSIEDYRSYRKTALSDIDSCFEILKNLDFAWTDYNAEVFSVTAKKDYSIIKNYFNFLDNYYNNLETFKNTMSHLCQVYGYSKYATINYSNDRIQKCINYLCDARDYIDDARRKMLDIVYPSDFRELDTVNNMLSNLLWVRNNINAYCDNVCNFSNRILGAVREGNERKARIGNFNEKLSNMKYSWSNVYMNTNNKYLNQNEDPQTEKYAGQGIDASGVNKAISGIGDNVDKRKSASQDIDASGVNKTISGIGDNVDKRKSASQDIDVTEVNKTISGIGDNVDKVENSKNLIEENRKLGKITESIGNAGNGVNKTDTIENSKNLIEENGKLGKITESIGNVGNGVSKTEAIKEKFDTVGTLSKSDKIVESIGKLESSNKEINTNGINEIFGKVSNNISSEKASDVIMNSSYGNLNLESIGAVTASDSNMNIELSGPNLDAVSAVTASDSNMNVELGGPKLESVTAADFDSTFNVSELSKPNLKEVSKVDLSDFMQQ